MPKVVGRGAGLGNEMIVWSKAYLASRALGLKLLHPAWGLNPRGYSRLFATSRLDWIYQRSLSHALRSIEFSESDYLRTGQVEYGAAISQWAKSSGLMESRSFVLLAEGMWGGFASIVGAREFVRGQLYRTRGTLDNLTEIFQRSRRDRLLCAIHARLGDFEPSRGNEDYRGVFNASVPLGWYVSVGRNLRKALGERVDFVLFTDGDMSQVSELVEALAPITTFHQRDSAASDLLAMSLADVLICSVSSYSMWAAFLSNRPYIWFAPNLQNHGAYYSLWGHEPMQRQEGSTTRQSARIVETETSVTGDGTPSFLPRGVPVDHGGEIPSPLLSHLENVLRMKRPETDLLTYGVVPMDWRKNGL